MGEEEENITEHFNRVFAGYLDKLPSAPSKVVRIFTSSTFTDTTIERNALMEEVYPKLKDFCREHHGLDFQVVDMRWGVRDEATDDHMTTQLCINEIYNCQRLSMGPNFVVFLCQKYGYRPLPTIILASEFDLLKETLKDMKEDTTTMETWYRLDSNAVPAVHVLQPISSILINFNNKRMPKLQEQDSAAWWEVMAFMQRMLRKAAKASYDFGKLNHEQMHNYFMSVTEREIINGVIIPKHTRDHCMCYVRHITDINLNNLRAAGKFVDIVNGQVDIEASRLLSNLRDERVPAKLEGANIVRFTIPWLGREGMEAVSHQEYLKEFCSSFYKGITGMVDRAVKRNARYMSDKVYGEILHHLHTCQQVSRLFHGRNDELKKINEYITGLNQQPMVLYGESGCGKTSVLAKVASNSRHSMVTGAVVIIRFLGTTPDSSSIVPLLTSLCEQIAYNCDQQRDICPSELSQLFAHFKKMMDYATEEQPLIILLDSLDLLTASDGAHELLWFPPTLNKHVKLLVSTTPGSKGVLETLKRIVETESNYVEILPLGQPLAEQVIREWLKDSYRTLTSKQYENVKKAFSKCTLPIFVKLVFATISRWKSYSRPQETMLAGSVHESIHALLDRTESQHGKLLVSHALSYITAAKNGVSESELEDLVSLDDKVLDDIYQYHLPPIRRIPPLLWTRIRSDLPGYLSERDSSGVIVLTWYHKQFSEAATERYFKNLNHLHFTHSSVADYFLGIWAGIPKPFQYTEIQKQRFGIMEREGLADRKVPQQPNVFYGRDGWSVRYNLRKLDELPYHLLRAERIDELFTKCLFNYDFLHSKVSSCSLQALLADFEDAYQRVKDKRTRRELFLIADALRLSASILGKHSCMLGFELTGRLLPLMNEYSLVRSLVLQCDTEGIKSSALVPMHHCFHSPGGPLKYSMEDHQFAVFGMQLTKDKRLLISVSDQFIVWDTSTGDIARTVRPDVQGIMFGLAISPDDRHAAVFNNHNDIVVMHMLTGEFVSFRDENLTDDMSVQNIRLTNTEVMFWTKTSWFIYDLHGTLVGRHPIEKLQIVLVEYISSTDHHMVHWSGVQDDPALVLQSQIKGQKIKPLPFQGGIVFDQPRGIMYAGEATSTSKVTRYKIVNREWKRDEKYALDDPNSTECVISLRILECETYLIAIIGQGYYIWNLETKSVAKVRLPQGVRNVPLKPLKVTSPIAFTLNYELFAAGVRKNIYIWNMSTEQLVQTLDAHFGRILGLLPLDTSQQSSLLSSSLDHTIKLWNMSNIFEKVYSIERLDKPIDQILLASDDENIALIVTRKYATVWNLKLHRIFATMADNAHGAVVTHALIRSDAKVVVTLESSNILVWDVNSSTVLHRETESSVVQMFLVENETVLVTVQKCPDKDLTACITARRMPNLVEIYRYEFSYRKYHGVIVTKGQALLVLISQTQTNRQCLVPVSSHNGEVLYKIRLHKGAELVDFKAMPHQSNQVVLIEQEKSTIWDIKNKKSLRSISRWTGICSSDGKLGLFAPARGGLEVLDLKKGQTLRTLIPRVIEGINEIRAEFTPCNTYILYYHNGHKTLRIFRTSDGQMISCFKPHAQLTTFVASKDGKRIVIGGVDGSVLVTALVDPQDPKSLHYLAKQPGRKVLADHLGVENIETEETLRSFANLRVVGKAVNKFKSLINHDQKPSAVCTIQ